MEVAKVTSKGQITIPISIRRKLEINEGDKVLFVYKPEGVLMVNPNAYQAGVADTKETAKAEATVKSGAPTQEKPIVKTPQKTAPHATVTEHDNEKAYIEADIVNEESEVAEIPEPKAPQSKQVTVATTGSKQVAGLDLSTLLDDIRSIGSNI